MKNKLAQLLANHSILILGLGREGFSSYQLVRQLFPLAPIGLADQKSTAQLDARWQNALSNDPNLSWHLGPSYLDKSTGYSLIIKSPGIKPDLIKPFSSAQLTSQANLFFQSFPGQIIAVTGTKGKSTVSALIHHCLKPLKRSRALYHLGNIGQPLLSIADNSLNSKSLAVCELSSFQTGSLSSSPKIAVILEFHPEHLDYYPNTQTYYQDKLNLIAHGRANQLVIAPAEHSHLNSIKKLTRGSLITFGFHSPYASIDQKQIYLNKKPIIRLNRVPLVGQFNYLNCLPAVLVATHYQLTPTQISKQLGSFQPLPHRLEILGRYRGLSFVNDSLATIPQATIAALQAIPQVSTLITGGMDRGLDYTDLAQAIQQSSVRTVILFPNTSVKIIKGLNQLNANVSIFTTTSMAQAVKLAYRHTPPHTTCLLSPAASSFNLFKNYADRGDQFKKYIKKFAKHHPNDQ